MRGEPTMLAHQGNQNNNSIGQFWARDFLLLPGTGGPRGLPWLDADFTRHVTSGVVTHS
jgi:hypothetical protein